MKEFKIGLCSVSFRKHSPEEILKEMAKAGLSIIEWGSDIHAPKGDRDALLSLASLQEEHGMTCSSYGTYFAVGIDSAEELEEYIHAAKILGTNILRLWAYDKKDSEEFISVEKERFFLESRRCAEIAEKNGVVLCMECHNRTFTNRKEGALELMHAVSSPYFRMYWQPNQFRSEEENLAAAEALSPYTENIHIFHWRGKEKFPLLEGKEIWKQYLKKFSGKETLLLEFMPDQKIESLKREADSLRTILEEIK